MRRRARVFAASEVSTTDRAFEPKSWWRIVPPKILTRCCFPGGTSPDRIRTNKEVQRLVREFDSAKKPIFSVGHGAQVLISSQLVRSRQVTGAHAIADDIRNAGGLYRDQPTVGDSNWVTTRGAEDLPQFNRTMLEKLSASGAALSA